MKTLNIMVKTEHFYSLCDEEYKVIERYDQAKSMNEV